jgi:hypothetical protein
MIGETESDIGKIEESGSQGSALVPQDDSNQIQ